MECRHVHSFWNLFASWWNSCNLPKVALTNNAKIYARHPEKRPFRNLNLCLIVARYEIYTAAKESETYSITAFKLLLKSKLSTESPSYSSICEPLDTHYYIAYFFFVCFCFSFLSGSSSVSSSKMVSTVSSVSKVSIISIVSNVTYCN